MSATVFTLEILVAVMDESILDNPIGLTPRTSELDFWHGWKHKDLTSILIYLGLLSLAYWYFITRVGKA